MKRSPLNTPHGSRTYGARHTPYNWKLNENANNRGYQSVNNSYQRFSVNNELQAGGDNFIPLNVSTPVTQHEKHNTNRYSPANGRNSASPGSAWYNNRNNYHATSRSNCNNRYSTYKHSGNQFHGQKRKCYKGMHRQANISAYIDINSFLEDPWEDLVKKFNSKEISKSETSKNESLCSLKLADNDLVKKSENKFSRDINLDDSQRSQETKNDQICIDISLETENTDLSQISNNSINLETDDICSSQDSLNENSYNINSNICGIIEEKDNTHSNALLTDIDQKNI
ncbi:GATA zinc finger domain-containing protein 15-like [Cataglyphis hispanica]|uniref:GATA zinc finger domain-containing protein 15-like n=1 Tax=Cataglyphis hispanica TaxID=1086592 RepID=UPI00218092DE|nr:GATA zinc finger domain-containing protein 15-like [Cataglyphis hispanica]